MRGKAGALVRVVVAGLVTVCFFLFFPSLNSIITYLETAATAILGSLTTTETTMFRAAPYFILGAIVFWGVYYAMGKVGGSGDSNNG